MIETNQACQTASTLTRRLQSIITRRSPFAKSAANSALIRRTACAALIAALLLAACPTLRAQRRPDIVVADFEGADYGTWTVTGEAFGKGPAQGALPNQMPVTGYEGHGLVNSFAGGDRTTGTLTSPPIAISRRYINFLVGGGNHPGETGLRLVVDGKEERAATGIDSERLEWATWDVRGLQGKSARIEIFDRATGGWGHINVDQITLSDTRKAEERRQEPVYNESYRPQFHFTARTGWLNDPNGLVFYKGEYHLFFQHNPFGTVWGNMTWGHAVSPDLVHWSQLPNALEPDRLGTMFSGSAVVDWANTSGVGSGIEPPLIAIYTAAGGTSPESKGQPFTQCIAWSYDHGRTWLKSPGNPVLPHIAGENRDPKVVWHAPTQRWIMALFLDKEEFALFSSPNLKDWTELQRFTMPGSSECPDFFEMPVVATSGDAGRNKWVFTGANGRYLVGDFDGRRFTPEFGPFAEDYGANYYAVQTYSDAPGEFSRIQVAWMNNGSYPNMPFNQQMSFPCTLTLRETPAGPRLFRWPVDEIKRLYRPAKTWRALDLKPDDNPLAGLDGDLWDIEAEFDAGDADAFGFRVRGAEVRYVVKEQAVHCLGRTGTLPLEPAGAAPADAPAGKPSRPAAPAASLAGQAGSGPARGVRLRLLVDRASIELFGNGGALSMTSCFLPPKSDHSLALFAEGGTARLVSLSVTPLKRAVGNR